MTPLEAAMILCAGIAARTVNTIVGSGSLITFPTLLAFGYSPLIANVSNTVGLVPGSVSGAIGYRRELIGQRPRAIRLGIAAGAGGLTGAVLLRVYPSAFATIVPLLVGVSLILVATGPRLSRALQRRRNLEGHGSWPLALAFYATAIYGGYFGAAMGIIMISLLAIFIADDIQSLNALKNVLVAVVNGVAGVFLIAVAPVDWSVGILIACGSIIGGQIGSTVGRRLPGPALRMIIIVVGVAAEAKLLL